MAILRVRLTRFLCDTHRLRRPAIVLAVLLAAAISSLAQSPANSPLTNADIVKMVKAGVPESVILRKVQISESNFATSPNALIDLKRQHVPDDVMAAMVDSEAVMRMPPGDANTVPPAVPHLHHLPTFDAAIRIDSKTEKVSVGKNQIKVEQAGVPIFTLKWKETQSK